MSGKPTLRIDKWLWHIRIVKTRSLAARLCETGAVKIGDRTIAKSSETVTPGDRVAVTHNGWLRILEVEALGDRRGPSTEARTRYREVETPTRLTGQDPDWQPLLGDEDL